MYERTLVDDAKLLTCKLCELQQAAREYDAGVVANTGLSWKSQELTAAAVEFTQCMINLRTRGQRNKKRK